MTVPGGRNIVGSVYARVLAEGSGLDRSIDDALERQAKKFEASGKRYGELQSKGFRDALDDPKNDPGEVILKLLDARRGDARSAGAAFGDSFTKGLKQRFGDQLGGMIDRAFRRELERRGVADVLRNPFEVIMQASDEATRQVEADSRRVENAVDRQARAWESYGHNLLVVHQREQRMQQDDAWASYARNVEVAARRADNALLRVSRLLDRTARGARRTSVSNPFPRSRWLRPLGEMISLGSKLPGLLLDAAGNALKFAGSIQQAFSQGTAGAGLMSNLKKLPNLLASAAGGAVGLAGSVAALLVVLGLLAAALSLLVPLIINLAAVLTALAASVVAGLIGALGAALPIAVALGPAVAAIAIAVISSGDAFKKASQPVIDWYNAVKKPITDNILGAYQNLVGGVQALFTGDNGGPLGNLLINSAAAVKQGTDEIIKALTAPAFLQSLGVLGGENGLPSLIAPLMGAAANFFTGLTGLLVPLLGPAKDLADTLLDITTRFTNFTNDSSLGGGQSKLALWFDKAWNSAKRLGGLIGSVFSAVFELLNAGQPTGDSFIDSITNAVQRLSDWIKNGGLIDFFQRAKDFVGPFGKAMEGLAKGIAAINTPENQKRLNDFLEWLGNVLPKIGDFIDRLSELGDKVFDVIDTIANFTLVFKLLDIALDLLTGHFGDAWDKIYKAFVEPFKNLGQDIIDGIVNGLTHAWNTFVGWWKDIWNGLIDMVKSIFGIHSPSTVFFDIGIDIIQGLWDGAVSLITTVIGWFASIPGLIIGALGDAGSLLVGWVSDALNGMWNFAKSFFSLGGDFLRYVGTIPDLIVSALGDVAGKLSAPFQEAWDSIKSTFEVGVADVISGLDELYRKSHQTSGAVGSALLGGNGGNLGAGLMAGGWIDRPSIYRGRPVGEYGLREVVLPMQLPLDQVNPEVREMARAARAAMSGRRNDNVKSDSRPNVTYDFDVHAPQSDPKAVAAHVLAFLPSVRT